MGRRSETPTPHGWHRARSLVESFRFAWSGFRTALGTQRNLRIDMVVALGAALLAWLLRLPPGQVALVILAAASVIGAELLNSALESLVDLVQFREDPVARRVKDMAAAAVLVTAVGAALVGLVLFLPPLVRLLSGS